MYDMKTPPFGESDLAIYWWSGNLLGEWQSAGGVAICWGSGHLLGEWPSTGGVAICWGSGNLLGEWPSTGGVAIYWGSGHLLGEWPSAGGVAICWGSGHLLDSLIYCFTVYMHSIVGASRLELPVLCHVYIVKAYSGAFRVFEQGRVNACSNMNRISQYGLQASAMHV